MWPWNTFKVTESGMNGSSSMTTTITHSATFITFTVSEKITELKLLPHCIQSAGWSASLTMIITTQTRIFHVTSQKVVFWTSITYMGSRRPHGTRVTYSSEQGITHSTFLACNTTPGISINLGQQHCRVAQAVRVSCNSHTVHSYQKRHLLPCWLFHLLSHIRNATTIDTFRSALKTYLFNFQESD